MAKSRELGVWYFRLLLTVLSEGRLPLRVPQKNVDYFDLKPLGK